MTRAAAPGKPKPKRRETKNQKAKRRALGVLKFGRRHVKVRKGKKTNWPAIGVWGGLLTIAASILLLRGVGAVSTGVAMGGVAAAGGIYRHHQRVKLTRWDPAVRIPTRRERREYEHGRRRGGGTRGPVGTQPRGSGPIWVQSHRRDGESVGGHWRSRPGDGGGPTGGDQHDEGGINLGKDGAA